MKHHKLSRRSFLGSVPCVALGTTTLYSSLINLKALNNMVSPVSAGGDYKALVCLLMNGGNDSYNMIIPTSNAEYQEYAMTRSNQALGQDEVIDINPDNGDGRTFGIHPAMTNLNQLFSDGKLAFINNVGTLIEPVTKASIESQTANLPLGLLSHSDQVMHWQTAFPQDRATMGWGGKMADILKAVNTSEEVSMNISLAGNNIFQRGDTITEYAINTEGGVAISGWENPDPFLSLMTEDIKDMLNTTYQDIFKDSYNGILRRSVESNEAFNDALENGPELMTPFSNNNLSQRLRMIARSISIREALGAKRQIFFVDIGGFDNHDELLNNQNALLQQVDAAMSEFYAATVELGVEDCVTTFTISDFARTLTSNGNGTDHAWGGNVMVMGGAVKGRNLYGDYPSLALNNPLELGGGILIPTTSADQYFAELALWFGLSPNDLSLVLPNIGNFYSASSGDAPLGFLL